MVTLNSAHHSSSGRPLSKSIGNWIWLVAEEEGDGEHCIKGCNSGGHVRSRNRLELVMCGEPVADGATPVQ